MVMYGAIAGAVAHPYSSSWRRRGGIAVVVPVTRADEITGYLHTPGVRTRVVKSKAASPAWRRLGASK